MPSSFDENRDEPAKARAKRDLVALGIAMAAIMTFVATGGSVIPQMVRNFLGQGAPPDPALLNAVILNIALIIFVWRRYAELNREIADRRSAEERARKLANTDTLTGCHNRRSFSAAIDEMRAEATTDGERIACMVIDFDNFKQINDVYGHAAGDSILRTFASRMGGLLPLGAPLARLGGDEFACAIRYAPDDQENIDKIATRMIEAVAQDIEFEAVRIAMTVSLGISVFDPQSDDCSETDSDLLLHYADIAMYSSKRAGKNRLSWFEPAMENEMRFRQELERGIREGIPQNEFVPYYEQQIDIETGELVGFEMLARWNSPHLGLVSPNIFIPVAEEMGRIGELSEHLIEQALQDALEWDPALTLSVNISPLQLRDPWFAQRLLKLLVKHNFPPQRLDIEITENALHENVNTTRAIIESLRNQGIRISLDDFGTGYASLAQLRALPFDRLKIDRSFVTELGEETADEKFVKAIVLLSEGLDLPVTAEGIETGEILEILRKFGQMKGQGYHYGHPQGAAETLELLTEKGLLARSEATEADPVPAVENAPEQGAAQA